MNCGIEILEDRRLFAATVTVAMDAYGTLVVTGTGGNDAITVTESNRVVSVTANRTNLGSFQPAKLIKIYGGIGGDTINFTGSTMGAMIYGEDGADVIGVSDPTAPTSTTRPASVVSGGGGGDKITVNRGLGTVVHGDAGGDTITAKAGKNLQLYGDADADSFNIYAAVSTSTVYKNAGEVVSNASTTVTIATV